MSCLFSSSGPRKGGFHLHPFPFDGLDEEDSNLEENIERPSQQGQVKDIRGWCDNGGNDRNEQEGIPPVSGERRSANHIEVAEQSQDEREFKRQPESENKKGTKGDIVSCRDHGLDMSGLIAQEKPDAERERHEVAEEGSEIKKERCSQENGRRRFHPSRAEDGGHGFPDLVKEDGHGTKKTGEQGEFNDGEKGLGNTKGHQIACQIRVSQVAKQLL